VVHLDGTNSTTGQPVHTKNKYGTTFYSSAPRYKAEPFCEEDLAGKREPWNEKQNRSGSNAKTHDGEEDLLGPTKSSLAHQLRVSMLGVTVCPSRSFVHKPIFPYVHSQSVTNHLLKARATP
jgi:hypothetical protein